MFRRDARMLASWAMVPAALRWTVAAASRVRWGSAVRKRAAVGRRTSAVRRRATAVRRDVTLATRRAGDRSPPVGAGASTPAAAASTALVEWARVERARAERARV